MIMIYQGKAKLCSEYCLKGIQKYYIQKYEEVSNEVIKKSLKFRPLKVVCFIDPGKTHYMSFSLPGNTIYTHSVTCCSLVHLKQQDKDGSCVNQC